MKNNKRFIILILIFIIIGTTIGVFYENKKKKLLSTNTKVTHGYLTKRINVARSCNESYYYYYIKNNKFEIWECGLKPFLEIGDTVLIKYSLEAPSVAKVIDFKFMKKFKI
ncbi:hypothetical protein [Brumimicrobium sp.]|uniref:hypothetical protein n=1 Tax=Brumimicrobium sp. TaxID=2029867 RepID=UPI003A920385